MKLKRVIIPAIFILIVPCLLSAGSQVYIEKVEFRGVKNADRYEIIRNSGAKVSGKGIMIDTGNLKDVLKSNVLIRNFDLDVQNNLMIITVEEKYPLFTVLKVEKNISIPCLVDEKRNVIDSGRFFRTDMPIIIVDKGFFDNADNSGYLDLLFGNLKQIAAERGDFAAELSEITVEPGGELRVKLKVRKTGFLTKNSMNGFRKIEKSAAYLDAVNSYPEIIDLRDRRILVGQ